MKSKYTGIGWIFISGLYAGVDFIRGDYAQGFMWCILALLTISEVLR